MTATRNLLSEPVGPKLRNKKFNVTNLQQLLTAAGYDTGGDSGIWDDKTTTALLGFRNEHFSESLPMEVLPSSDELVILARLAQIEISLPGATGMNGIQRMHNWFEDSKTKYNVNTDPKKGWSLGDRAIYGIGGHTGSAIQSIKGAWRKGPVEMDCTTYVNLMLGIFKLGNCHQDPYDASCKDFGGLSQIHCGKNRYGFTEISATFGKETRSYVKTADEMTAVMKENTLYVLEAATSSGYVVHMALLYNGNVMECRPAKVCRPESECINGSITDFIRRMGCRIFMYEQPA